MVSFTYPHPFSRGDAGQSRGFPLDIKVAVPIYTPGGTQHGLDYCASLTDTVSSVQYADSRFQPFPPD